MRPQVGIYGSMENVRRGPWLTMDWFLVLVCGVALQLLCTLDYSAITRVTKEVMSEHAAMFSSSPASHLVEASLAREVGGGFNSRWLPSPPALKCGAPLASSSSRRVSLGPAVVSSAVSSTFRGLGPEESYQWSYKVTFANEGDATVQLLTRRWSFANAAGGSTDVAGPGARGSTRVLAPGETWSYESGTTLDTPTGSFSGSFAFGTGSTFGSFRLTFLSRGSSW